MEFNIDRKIPLYGNVGGLRGNKHLYETKCKNLFTDLGLSMKSCCNEFSY